MSAKPNETSAPYEVGYGRPPVQHRFRKGQSGNPRGRQRRDTRALPPPSMKEAFLKAANQPLTMTVEGQQVTTTRGEAVYHRLVAEAVKGNMRAMKLFLEHMRMHTAEASAILTHEQALEMLWNEPPEPQNIVVSFVKPGDSPGPDEDETRSES